MSARIELDPDKLCSDLHTTAGALAWQADALAGIEGGGRLGAGHRDTLCALIERNLELVDRLVGYVEGIRAASDGNVSIPVIG